MIKYLSGDFPANSIFSITTTSAILTWGFGKDKSVFVDKVMQNLSIISEDEKIVTFSCTLLDGRKLEAQADPIAYKKLHNIYSKQNMPTSADTSTHTLSAEAISTPLVKSPGLMNRIISFFKNIAMKSVTPMPAGVYRSYEIKGLYLPTMRNRTITVKTTNLECSRLQLLKDGYSEPFEITEDPSEPPTEAQMKFAQKLSLSVPADVTMDDMRAILNNHASYRGNGGEPNPELLEYAIRNNLCYSAYMCKKDLYNNIWCNLQGQDKIAFFIFCIYRSNSDDRRGDLDSHPYNKQFYEWANQLVNDKSFVKSMEKYSGLNVRFFGTLYIKKRDKTVFSCEGGSITTIAYKQVAELLKEKYQIQPLKYKTLDENRR